jgi:hypothetical protein
MMNRHLKQVLLLTLALTAGSCAALQPPGATGPRGNEPLYPVLFTEDNHRKEATALALNRLFQTSGSLGTTGPQFQPITATIASLPTNPGNPLYLPKVGTAAVMNEEETRESLRRFIKDWQELIGADPSKLSLVDRLDQPDGSKVANYEQRPFRYAIRGNYGKLQIRFTPDRRVLNLSSTCIPDADRVQTALAGVSVKLKPEDVIKQLRENGVTYTDRNGNKLSFRVAADKDMNPRELIIYILPSQSQLNALEFHVCWEVELNNAPIKIAYLDAVNGEIVGAE